MVCFGLGYTPCSIYVWCSCVWFATVFVCVCLFCWSFVLLIVCFRLSYTPCLMYVWCVFLVFVVALLTGTEASRAATKAEEAFNLALDYFRGADDVYHQVSVHNSCNTRNWLIDSVIRRLITKDVRSLLVRWSVDSLIPWSVDSFYCLHWLIHLFINPLIHWWLVSIEWSIHALFYWLILWSVGSFLLTDSFLRSVIHCFVDSMLDWFCKTSYMSNRFGLYYIYPSCSDGVDVLTGRVFFSKAVGNSALLLRLLSAVLCVRNFHVLCVILLSLDVPIHSCLLLDGLIRPSAWLEGLRCSCPGCSRRLLCARWKWPYGSCHTLGRVRMIRRYRIPGTWYQASCCRFLCFCSRVLWYLEMYICRPHSYSRPIYLITLRTI